MLGDRPGHFDFISVLDCIPSFNIEPNVWESGKERPNTTFFYIRKMPNIKYSFLHYFFFMAFFWINGYEPRFVKI